MERFIDAGPRSLQEANERLPFISESATVKYDVSLRPKEGDSQLQHESVSNQSASRSLIIEERDLRSESAQ